MNKLMKNTFSEIKTSEISDHTIEKTRREVINTMRFFEPSIVKEFEGNLRSLRILLEKYNEVESNASFLGGYLLGAEDILEALLYSSKDQENYSMFINDSNLLKICVFLSNVGLASSNKIAKGVGVNGSTVSRIMANKEYQEKRIFHMDQDGQRKYYSLTVFGKRLYLEYQQKRKQIQEFKKHKMDPIDWTL